MSFSDTLKNLRKNKNVTQEELAAILGIERSSIGKYESANVTPSVDVLKKMAKFFNVSTDFLLGRDEVSLQISNILPIMKKKIPLLGEIACGKPVFADEQHETFVIPGQNIDADFCLKANGDSMTGARILDGDIVFIKSTPIVDNGDIAAVIIGDEATLKRVYYYREQNKLVLVAENTKYPPLVYTDSELDEIRILGKAVAFSSIIK